MDKRESETFQYTYSARQQEEIKAIRKKYAAPEEAEDKMAQLRCLDASVTRRATASALVFGVTGALLLGTGMSLIMTDLAGMLGLARSGAMIIGVTAGIAGILLAACAYPVYDRVTKKQRKRIAPEIIRLSDELLK